MAQAGKCGALSVLALLFLLCSTNCPCAGRGGGGHCGMGGGHMGMGGGHFGMGGGHFGMGGGHFGMGGGHFGMGGGHFGMGGRGSWRIDDPAVGPVHGFANSGGGVHKFDSEPASALGPERPAHVHDRGLSATDRAGASSAHHFHFWPFWRRNSSGNLPPACPIPAQEATWVGKPGGQNEGTIRGGAELNTASSETGIREPHQSVDPCGRASGNPTAPWTGSPTNNTGVTNAFLSAPYPGSSLYRFPRYHRLFGSSRFFSNYEAYDRWYGPGYFPAAGYGYGYGNGLAGLPGSWLAALYALGATYPYPGSYNIGSGFGSALDPATGLPYQPAYLSPPGLTPDYLPDGTSSAFGTPPTSYIAPSKGNYAGGEADAGDSKLPGNGQNQPQNPLLNPWRFAPYHYGLFAPFFAIKYPGFPPGATTDHWSVLGIALLHRSYQPG